MKYNRVITTAVLLLLLGTTIPAFAQKGEEEKGGGGEKAQPAQHQAQQKQQPQRAEKAQPQQAKQAKAQPQRAEKAQPQRAQQAKQQPQRAQKAQPQAVASNRGNNGGQYGRISNANYSAHFGQGHSFHMGHPQISGGYNRFQYGGYWFGYNEGWPVGWDYNDDCYVVFVDGGYYMYDLRHPGIRITLRIFS
jgi:hypothetical protein